MRFIWPLFIMMIFQMVWNIVLAAFLGKFESKFGDWIYSRKCGYAMTCDGNFTLSIIWCCFAALLIINLIYQVYYSSSRKD